jgi:hypothetical protein
MEEALKADANRFTRTRVLYAMKPSSHPTPVKQRENIGEVKHKRSPYASQVPCPFSLSPPPVQIQGLLTEPKYS